MALQLWETLKEAITAYTGLSPTAFFTILALALAVYHVVSGFFVSPVHPVRERELFKEMEPLPPPVQLGEITEEELKTYDGSDSKKPLLMAIKGQIYDVSQGSYWNIVVYLVVSICSVQLANCHLWTSMLLFSEFSASQHNAVECGRIFYGPGGPYALFAGKDASRALAKMSFEEQDLTGDLSDLGPFELEALQDWEYKFMSKYTKVGTIKKTFPVTDGSSTVEPSETTDRDIAKPAEDGPSESLPAKPVEATTGGDAQE
ncbi:Membrane steroid-binding protein 2 [Vitis vinifera]|uniref:Membrane steroid-binding protein 2 n=1 Tax=Vitis vinifera TaxID=29760 RepID=A0A438CV39_VITVI|nr:Membrane steroid-binding protein 2 [Vitis vinifera]